MIKLKHISSLTSSALVIVLLLTVIVSCGTQPENKAYSSKIDGDWVLSNFLDRVIESKSIAPHFKQKLSWDAIILRFKNDTVEIHGLLTNTRALWPKDSKSMQMGTSTGNYLFAFNETLNTIEARSTNNQDSIQYVFRKALPSDKNLFIGLDEVSNTQQLKKNFNAYIINTLFESSYKSLPLSKENQVLKLSRNGSVKGFKNFDTFQIHDYFGSHHPFPSDAIVFTDSKANQPNSNVESYQWKFIGDSLILTEYLTENNEVFSLGKRKYTYQKLN